MPYVTFSTIAQLLRSANIATDFGKKLRRFPSREQAGEWPGENLKRLIFFGEKRGK
jgi:hypothetical protein